MDHILFDFHTVFLPNYYLDIAWSELTRDMSLLRVTNQEIFFHSSRTGTILGWEEFGRLFQITSQEIEKQRQSQFALARVFFERASQKFRTKPSRAEVAQLLLECMQSQTQLDNAEPTVLTMEIAETLANLASGTAPPFFSSGTRDFLTEAGILPLKGSQSEKTWTTPRTKMRSWPGHGITRQHR